MQNDEVTILMIGDTGVGKSSFGNIYLEKPIFEASDSTDPVTLKADAQSNKINGCTRYAIDTVGFNDGQSIDSVQIQNLAILMRNYLRGVNGIVIVLNGMCDRFSQGVKDVIRFSYNAFGTREALSHICLVFTKCIDKNYPNRDTKRTKYRDCVRKYLSEISGVQLDQVPEIPVFFVDCYPRDNDNETKENMVQFHGWVCSRRPLSTKKFKEAVQIHEDRVEEVRMKVSVGFQTRGDTTYEIFEDQKRFKYLANGNVPERFTKWTCIKKYEEAIKITIIEKRNDVDLGFRYNNDGSVKYKILVDQERKIVRDLRLGRDIDTTGWVNISKERKIEVARCTERKETRQRKFERKTVEHYQNIFFDRSRVKIYHVTYTEQRSIYQDCEGKCNYSDWLIVPGSEETKEINSFIENGWTNGYNKEIAV
ncbi:hypothetical protein M9Y10_035724 [Tritrichomonas musculus]|uniref:AIG1-type G domain-containing protein n=1 Tax=Tritrichomonas musculus TaxID=1915356 RepID=A0ABR2GWR3_9EUKA